MLEQKTLLTFYVFIIYTFLCLAVMQFMSLFSVSPWLGLGVGLGILVILFVIYLILKRKRGRSTRKKRLAWINLVMLNANAIACGLMISSIYAFSGTYPTLLETLIVYLCFVVLMFIYCLITLAKFAQKHYILCLILYSLAIFIGAIVLVIITKNPIYALNLCFWLIISTFLITLSTRAYNYKDHLNNIFEASLLSITLVGLIAIAVLGDGDIDNLGDDFFPQGQQKGNPYAYIIRKQKQHLAQKTE